MKSYSFSNLTVRPFPTIADLNNPWIFGGVQVLINVSGHEYPKEILDSIESKGIRWYHKPPFDGSTHITGHNLFVSAYHGFAQLGNEHVPEPTPWEDFTGLFWPIQIARLLMQKSDLSSQTSVISGRSLALRIRCITGICSLTLRPDTGTYSGRHRS